MTLLLVPLHFGTRGGPPVRPSLAVVLLVTISR